MEEALKKPQKTRPTAADYGYESAADMYEDIMSALESEERDLRAAFVAAQNALLVLTNHLMYMPRAAPDPAYQAEKRLEDRVPQQALTAAFYQFAYVQRMFLSTFKLTTGAELDALGGSELMSAFYKRQYMSVALAQTIYKATVKTMLRVMQKRPDDDEPDDDVHGILYPNKMKAMEVTLPQEGDLDKDPLAIKRRTAVRIMGNTASYAMSSAVRALTSYMAEWDLQDSVRGTGGKAKVIDALAIKRAHPILNENVLSGTIAKTLTGRLAAFVRDQRVLLIQVQQAINAFRVEVAWSAIGKESKAENLALSNALLLRAVVTYAREARAGMLGRETYSTVELEAREAQLVPLADAFEAGKKAAAKMEGDPQIADGDQQQHWKDIQSAVSSVADGINVRADQVREIAAALDAVRAQSLEVQFTDEDDIGRDVLVNDFIAERECVVLPKLAGAHLLVDPLWLLNPEALQRIDSEAVEVQDDGSVFVKDPKDYLGKLSISLQNFDVRSLVSDAHAAGESSSSGGGGGGDHSDLVGKMMKQRTSDLKATEKRAAAAFDRLAIAVSVALAAADDDDDDDTDEARKLRDAAKAARDEINRAVDRLKQAPQLERARPSENEMSRAEKEFASSVAEAVDKLKPAASAVRDEARGLAAHELREYLVPLYETFYLVYTTDLTGGGGRALETAPTEEKVTAFSEKVVLDYDKHAAAPASERNLLANVHMWIRGHARVAERVAPDLDPALFAEASAQIAGVFDVQKLAEDAAGGGGGGGGGDSSELVETVRKSFGKELTYISRMQQYATNVAETISGTIALGDLDNDADLGAARANESERWALLALRVLVYSTSHVQALNADDAPGMPRDARAFAARFDKVFEDKNALRTDYSVDQTARALGSMWEQGKKTELQDTFLDVVEDVARERAPKEALGAADDLALPAAAFVKRASPLARQLVSLAAGALQVAYLRATLAERRMFTMRSMLDDDFKGGGGANVKNHKEIHELKLSAEIKKYFEYDMAKDDPSTPYMQKMVVYKDQRRSEALVAADDALAEPHKYSSSSLFHKLPRVADPRSGGESAATAKRKGTPKRKDEGDVVPWDVVDLTKDGDGDDDVESTEDGDDDEGEGEAERPMEVDRPESAPVKRELPESDDDDDDDDDDEDQPISEMLRKREERKKKKQRTKALAALNDSLLGMSLLDDASD